MATWKPPNHLILDAESLVDTSIIDNIKRELQRQGQESRTYYIEVSENEFEPITIRSDIDSEIGLSVEVEEINQTEPAPSNQSKRPAVIEDGRGKVSEQTKKVKSNPPSGAFLHGKCVYEDGKLRFIVRNLPLLRQKNNVLEIRHFGLTVEPQNEKAKLPLLKHYLDGITISLHSLFEELEKTYPLQTFFVTILAV